MKKIKIFLNNFDVTNAVDFLPGSTITWILLHKPLSPIQVIPVLQVAASLLIKNTLIRVILPKGVRNTQLQKRGTPHILS